MKYLIKLSLVILNLTGIAAAQDCSITKTPPVTYFNEARGDVVLYETANLSELNVTNLVCALGNNFFSKIDKFPDKATVGIVDRSYENVAIIQWNLKQSYFLIIQVTYGVGTFIKYPEPLERIKEVLIGAQLPSQESLPEHLKRKYSSNTLRASPEQLKKLIEGNVK